MKKYLLFIIILNTLSISLASNKLDQLAIKAALKKDFKTMKILVLKGADVNSKDKKQFTLLHIAAKKAPLSIVKFLVKNGANIHYINGYGYSVLHSAALGGKYTNLKFLINRGMSVNLKNFDNNTILHSAVLGGNLKIVKFLLLKGADINAYNRSKQTIVTYAYKFRKNVIKKYLIKKGAKRYSNLKNTPGNMPGNFYWVESHAQKTYIKLNTDDFEEYINLPIKPIDNSYKVWIQTISDEIVGNYKTGESFDLYSLEGDYIPKIKIKRFVLLTRGQPHFGYNQQIQESGKEPERPGCGSPLLFAEVGLESGAFFARKSNSKKAILFDEYPGSVIGGDKLAKIEKVILSDYEYKKAKLEAQKIAKRDNSSITQNIEYKLYKSNRKKILIVSVDIYTGAGDTACGANDYATLLRVVIILNKNYYIRDIIMPLSKYEERHSPIKKVIDLNDGTGFKIIEERWQKKILISPESGVIESKIEEDFCDCGC